MFKPMKTAYFTVAACLAIAFSLPALAGTKDDRERDHNVQTDGNPPAETTDQARTRQDPTQRFVESNVLETLYHEMGHALIDTMQLPVFGPEEFAADFFAAVLLDRVHGEKVTRQLIEDVTRSYQEDHRADRAAGNSTSAWDTHGTPMQRYYNLACLYYGADPEGRKHALKDFGLSDRADFCVGDYEMANYAWGDVLDQLAEDAPGDTIKLDWVLDNESHLTQFVKREVAALNKMMSLPQAITVSVIPCGEVNAYYDPEPREVIICTELAEHLEKLAP